MKALALETVVKFIIFLATASILLSLVLFFSDSIRNYIKEWTQKPEVKTEIIEKDSFTSSQLAAYITSCWDKTGEKYRKDATCYVLKGDMIFVDVNEVKKMTIAPNVDLSSFDNTKGIAIIEFKSLGKVIVVRS